MNPSVKADLIGFLSSLLRLIKDHNKINVNRWRKRVRGEITCKRITSNMEGNIIDLKYMQSSVMSTAGLTVDSFPLPHPQSRTP